MEEDVSDNVLDIVLESEEGEDDDHGVEDKSDGKLTFDEIFEYITIAIVGLKFSIWGIEKTNSC